MDFKHKIAVHRLGATKKNHKTIRKDKSFWSTIQNWKGYTQINTLVKQYLYDRILKHPQITQPSISNYHVKVSDDDHTEKQVSLSCIAVVFQSTSQQYV